MSWWATGVRALGLFTLLRGFRKREPSLGTSGAGSSLHCGRRGLAERTEDQASQGGLGGGGISAACMRAGNPPHSPALHGARRANGPVDTRPARWGSGTNGSADNPPNAPGLRRLCGRNDAGATATACFRATRSQVDPYAVSVPAGNSSHSPCHPTETRRVTGMNEGGWRALKSTGSFGAAMSPSFGCGRATGEFAKQCEFGTPFPSHPPHLGLLSFT